MQTVDIVPSGWTKTGKKHGSYRTGQDKDAGRDGGVCTFIELVRAEDEPVQETFCTLMQMFEATDYLNCNLKLSGWIRTADLPGFAGLWMRIDGPEQGKSLAFDNMFDRQIKGTTGWKQYEVILPVPENATRVAFGVLLHRSGKVWMESFEFDKLPFDLENSTDRNRESKLPKAPRNLRAK